MALELREVCSRRAKEQAVPVLITKNKIVCSMDFGQTTNEHGRMAVEEMGAY